MAKKKRKKLLSRVIHEISFHPEERVVMFLGLPHPRREAVLQRLSRHVVYDIVSRLPDKELLESLELLDLDEVTDTVRLLPKKRREKVLASLKKELREGVVLLSQFEPETAASLMSLDYIQVEARDSVAEVAKQFKAHEKRTGKPPVIVVLEEGKMLGFLPGHELGFGKPSEKVKKYVKKMLSVEHNASYRKVAGVFRRHPHSKVAVMGENDSVMGIIYSDDILKLMEGREASSLYDFAGVADEETIADTTKAKVKSRYKWLIVNLGTGFLAAFVVGLFDETISKYVLLAVYMPIVAGMGGNAATQTLAILVRGISQRQISLRTALPTLRRELGAALVNGLINGLIVATIVIVFSKDVKIALILAAAMVVNLLVAAFFGTLVPLVMKALGKDPATSATIFITTATDVLGFLAFLGLATLVLS